MKIRDRVHEKRSNTHYKIGENGSKTKGRRELTRKKNGTHSTSSEPALSLTGGQALFHYEKADRG